MRKLLTPLLAAILLAGCASTDTPGDRERFEQGREAYMAGDYGAAFERLITEAEAGNPEAQYTIGYMYYEGQGVGQDEDRALQWIRRAAEGGSEPALKALGELASMGGRGAPQGMEETESAPAEGHDDGTIPPGIEEEIQDELPEELR